MFAFDIPIEWTSGSRGASFTIKDGNPYAPVALELYLIRPDNFRIPLITIHCPSALVADQFLYAWEDSMLSECMHDRKLALWLESIPK